VKTVSAEVLHKWKFHTIFFWAFVVVIGFANGAYTAIGIKPSGSFALLYRAGLL
jgi:hypothetical protein